jgi:hypothetical protein
MRMKPAKPEEPATEEEKAIIKNILYLKKFRGQEKSILGQLRYSNKQAVEKALMNHPHD